MEIESLQLCGEVPNQRCIAPNIQNVDSSKTDHDLRNEKIDFKSVNPLTSDLFDAKMQF
jgi:hypothetical protein